MTNGGKVMRARSIAKAKREGARGFLYFIRCADWIRIGFTRDLNERLAAYLGNCAPHQVLCTIADVTMGHEAEWHDRFRRLRVIPDRPSWYHAKPELVAAIEDAKRDGATSPAPVNVSGWW